MMRAPTSECSEETLGSRSFEGKSDHQEQRWADRDDAEHDRHRQRLGDQIRTSIERRCQVDPEHAGPAIGAQKIGGDERGEQVERGDDEAVVLGIGGQELLADGVGDQCGDADENDRRGEGEQDDGDRDDLVTGGPSQAKASLDGVPDQRAHRSADAAPFAGVLPVAAVEDLGGHEARSK